MTLDEIEAQLKFSEEDGDVAAEWAWNNGDLLIRAVRQLGKERVAYQKLFEAVDNDYEAIKDAHPEIYDAYDVITATPEPEDDVVALLEKA